MERGSQIVKPLKGMAKLGHKWAGTSPDVEPEEDHIAENGTDYDPVEKGMGGDEDRMDAVKEMMMAAKKGKNKASMDMEEEEMSREEEDDEDMDKGMYGRMYKAEDEDEEEEEEGMEKSFADVVFENPILVEGMNSSPFLLQMVKSIAVAFDHFDATTTAIEKSFSSDQMELAKSFDGAFTVMGSRLGLIDSTAGAIDMHKSDSVDSDNVAMLAKGGFSEDGENISKGDILSAMIKSVEAGQISPLEVIKFETTGQVNPSLLKSLNV